MRRSLIDIHGGHRVHAIQASSTGINTDSEQRQTPQQTVPQRPGAVIPATDIPLHAQRTRSGNHLWHGMIVGHAQLVTGAIIVVSDEVDAVVVEDLPVFAGVGARLRQLQAWRREVVEGEGESSASACHVVGEAVVRCGVERGRCHGCDCDAM